MQIINYFECDTKNELIEKIEACDWGAAKFLAELFGPMSRFSTS